MGGRPADLQNRSALDVSWGASSDARLLVPLKALMAGA